MFQDVLNPIINSPEFNLAKNLCTLFYVVILIAVAFWAFRDANRRGAMGWFWALIVLVTFGIGWIVYLIVRPPMTLEDRQEQELEIRAREAALERDYEACPSCSRPVEPDFLICPSCMKKLRKPCIECSRALRLNWQVCPYCKTKQ
jgi:RNA polymerase subunit RPABC4/transcription elongation factor Spt4